MVERRRAHRPEPDDDGVVITWLSHPSLSCIYTCNSAAAKFVGYPMLTFQTRGSNGS
jgi:hypothetical protein